MRGHDIQQDRMFSYLSPEERVPATHPLRQVRLIVDQILKEMSPTFQRMYSRIGRPSIPPEKLLRALLLQIFYSVRSERLLMEQLEYNLLFRWFVGLSMDDPVWEHSSFAGSENSGTIDSRNSGTFEGGPGWGKSWSSGRSRLKPRVVPTALLE